MKEVNELISPSKAQEDRGIDVTVLYSKDGKIQARLFTHELIRNDNAKPPFADMKHGMKVEFFDDSSKVKNTLTARNARWYTQEGNILIRDSVKIINDKGEMLETSEMVWNQTIKKFFTEKDVSITTPTQVIYGKGMEANQDFSLYQITKITGMVRVKKTEVPGG
jgi:LPS export ABC transporter protein LptC